ncbi:MAG: hypothetical protein RJB13_1055 [Pseudomonadota bacterium]
MRKNFIFSASAVLVALCVASCSAPVVRAPDPIRFTTPDSPVGSGFSLSGEAPQGVFRGGLLFWSQGVASEQIKTLLIANKETNQKYVNLQRYFLDFMRNEVEPLRTRVEGQRQQFAVSKLRSHARVAPLQAEKAASWYERELDAIQIEFPDFDRRRADQIFSAYCDAKILDLAARPLLAKSQFTSRPTPSAICESYYKARFFDGPECTDSSIGKNYYRCIWNEGVARTELGRRMQIRVAERKGGVRTSEPISINDFSSLETIRGAFAHEDVPYCAATEVRRNFLTGVRFRVLSSGVILGGLSCGQNTRFEISYGPGDWNSDLATFSAGALINAIESQGDVNTVPESFRWIETTAAERDPVMALRVEVFARKLAMFHGAVTGCDSYLNSANDVFFNDGRLVSRQESQGACRDKLPAPDALPEVIVVDTQLESERVELNRLEENLKSLKGNSCTAVPSCELVPQGHARCDYLNAQVRKAAAAEVKGVADVLVTDFALSFRREAASASTVVLSINGAAVAVGCVGEMNSGKCTESSSDPELSSAQQLAAEVTSAGELLLKMSVDTKQMAAAGVPQSVVAQFAPFEQSTMELSVTSNNFEGLVPYLSGKAYFKSRNDGDILSEGSVSYLIENTFDRTLGAFCSAR